MFAALNTAVAAAFGESATIRRHGQPDVIVPGIFDSRHYQAETSDGNAVSSLHTSLTVFDADTAGPVLAGALVDVRGRTYRVFDRRPDGQGMTVLALGDV